MEYSQKDNGLWRFKSSLHLEGYGFETFNQEDKLRLDQSRSVVRYTVYGRKQIKPKYKARQREVSLGTVVRPREQPSRYHSGGGRMRKLFDVWLLILVLLLVAMYLNVNTAFKEMKAEYEAKELMYQQEKEHLEKEIRLLKTDIDILTNGFEK